MDDDSPLRRFLDAVVGAMECGRFHAVIVFVLEHFKQGDGLTCVHLSEDIVELRCC